MTNVEVELSLSAGAGRSCKDRYDDSRRSDEVIIDASDVAS
jgi:hypothetical protein